MRREETCEKHIPCGARWQSFAGIRETSVHYCTYPKCKRIAKGMVTGPFYYEEKK